VLNNALRLNIGWFIVSYESAYSLGFAPALRFVFIINRVTECMLGMIRVVATVCLLLGLNAT